MSFYVVSNNFGQQMIVLTLGFITKHFKLPPVKTKKVRLATVFIFELKTRFLSLMFALMTSVWFHYYLFILWN